MGGIMGNKEKILIFMGLTRANIQLPPNQDPMSLVIPVIYNISQNQTMLANLEKGINNPNLHAVLTHLSNSATMRSCTIYPAIHDLLVNLNLPNEGAGVP